MHDTPSPREFARALAPALRQAASIARALEGRAANRPKSGEVTAIKAALTVADTAAQEALLTRLFEHFPYVSLAAEEDTPSVGRFPETAPAQVVIDPIDGTLRFYLERAGPYATMIGLAIGGRYEAGLVALPGEGIFLEAVRGEGARRSQDDEESQPVRVGEGGNRVWVSHDLPAPVVERLQARGFEVEPASGGAISVAPLIPGVRAGLRLAKQNPEGVSIRGRIGALIAAEAGAIVSGADGPFPEAIHEPCQALLVAETEDDHALLEDALRAID